MAKSTLNCIPTCDVTHMLPDVSMQKTMIELSNALCSIDGRST